MKKILSILCAISVLMSVLIVPSAFAALAAAPELGATTQLTPTATDNVTSATETVNGIEAVSYTKGDWGRYAMNFDYEIEAGYNYFFTYDFSGNSNYASYSKPMTATAVSDINAFPDSNTAGTVLNYTKSYNCWNSFTQIFSGDELVKNGGKYFSIFWVYDEGDKKIANMTITKIKSDNGLMPSKLHNVAQGIDSDGDITYTTGTWNAGSITFDYEIEADYTYLITFDYKGKSYAQSLNPSLSTVATPELYLNNPNPNGYISPSFPNSPDKFTQAALLVEGNDLLESGGKYLIINWVHLDPISIFKNFKISKFVLPEDSIIPTALKAEMSFAVDGDRYCWYADIASEKYAWPTFTTDYVLEAGKKYAITFDYKGSTPVGGMWFGASEQKDKSYENIITEIQQFTLTSSEVWTKGMVILDTANSEAVTESRKYFAFKGGTSWGAAIIWFSNLKISEFDDDSLTPQSVKGFEAEIENGKMLTHFKGSTGENEYLTVGFTTGFELKAGKEYVVAFDYKLSDFDGKDSCWFDHPVTLFASAAQFDSEKIRDGKIKSLFNNEATATEWTEYINVFSADNVDETNKYLGIYAMAAPGKDYDLSFKEIRVYDNGDVNFDGEINTADLVLLKKTILGADNTGAKHTNISADDEGITDIIDLVAMKKLLAEKA